MTSIDILTVTYYDDYSFTGKIAFNTANKIDDYIDNDGVANGYKDRVMGLVTTTKTRVLDNLLKLNWIVSTTYYDNKYRAIQNVSQYSTDETDNAKKLFGTYSFSEILSSRYSFDGKLIMSKTVQTLNGTNELTKYYVYDHAGRLSQVYDEVNGDSNGSILTSKIEYNELSQVKNKKLHVNNSGVCIQKVDYEYNIRGWLTHINNRNDINTKWARFFYSRLVCSRIVLYYIWQWYSFKYI